MHLHIYVCCRVWVYIGILYTVSSCLVIRLGTFAPPPEVDGRPVGQVEEDEHNGENAEEDQVCAGEPVRSVDT